MKEIQKVENKPKATNISREASLNLIRQGLKDYSAVVKAIFELSYYSSISVFQLIDLNVSDINIKEQLANVNKNGNIQCIPIPNNCIEFLKEIIETNSDGNAPLFRNNLGLRLSIQEIWSIKRLFWLYS